jgi:CRP/FNR family transcriptional regulator
LTQAGFGVESDLSLVTKVSAIMQSADFSSLPAPLAELLAKQGRVVEVEANTPLFQMGDACQAFVMVLSGKVRVQQLSEAGRELVLYRIAPGQSCVITTACLLSSEPYPVEAVSEAPSRIALLPQRDFDAAFASNAEFRASVFATYGQRMAQMMGLLAELAFEPLDRRLARHLLRHADGEGHLEITQDRLAAELGSAREAVNRKLNLWQRQNWVELARGQVIVLDQERLKKLTEMTS